MASKPDKWQFAALDACVPARLILPKFRVPF